jgi:spore germination protein GerM
MVALAALALVGCGGDDSPEGETGPAPGEGETAESEAAEPEDQGEQGEREESSIVPLQSRQVTLYFPSVYQNGLVGEPHEIFETAAPGDRAKQILADLIEGPDEASSLPAVPPGIRFRQVYYMDDGTAYADFSGELAHRVGGGSMMEILTVYAIVNSLALNIPEIERVGILLDGKECTTLNGHLDLRRPLRPDPDLVLDSAAGGPAPDTLPAADGERTL